jgi:hypothetical protein
MGKRDCAAVRGLTTQRGNFLGESGLRPGAACPEVLHERQGEQP